MAERGRMGWRKATGYGRRNQAETAMARYKHLIGPRLRARSLLDQQGEAAIAVAVLNTVIRTAKPISIGSPGQRPVPSETGDTKPTQRDRHLQQIARHGRMAWRRASGYTTRARAETAIGWFKQVIGDGLHSRTDERRPTEVDVAVHALNRMLEFGRSNHVRAA